jgi:hypothetical protein
VLLVPQDAPHRPQARLLWQVYKVWLITVYLLHRWCSAVSMLCAVQRERDVWSRLKRILLPRLGLTMLSPRMSVLIHVRRMPVCAVFCRYVALEGGSRMILDGAALANLDVVAPGSQLTLLKLLDSTVTPFGAATLYTLSCRRPVSSPAVLLVRDLSVHWNCSSAMWLQARGFSESG